MKRVTRSSTRKRTLSSVAADIMSSKIGGVEENGKNKKCALLHVLGEHHYAIATTNTAFKHMMSLSMDSDSSIVISFLNCFVPAFRGDEVSEVKEVHAVIPSSRQQEEKQTFIDFHITSSQGTQYIIKMQAQRHVMFDEVTLFHACATYASQLPENELSTENGYMNLKPVIVVQVLDYDTNRIPGRKEVFRDTLVKRKKQNRLQNGQFVKKYMFVEEQSGQVIDYLQIIQVESREAAMVKQLFPPGAYFSLSDWWLSILHYANKYTSAIIERLYKEGSMPIEIYKALNRLDLNKWDSLEREEYQNELIRRDLYATTLAVEREEGKQEVIRAIALKMKEEAMPINDIARLTGLSAEVIGSLS